MSTNEAIPALFQGVSQQPAALRALEQCEVLDNRYVTVAEGCRDRPPTQWVKRLTNGTPSNAKVHQYFRGDGEHNIILVAYDTALSTAVIEAFDGVTGNSRSITAASGTLGYLATLNAVDDIGCLTVADTTYIWNRTVVTAMLTPSVVTPTPRLFVYVKEGLANTKYMVTITGVGTASYDPADASINRQTTNIAEQLRTQVAAMTGMTATRFNNLVVIQRSDSADFTFSLADDAGDTAMYAFKNRVERYSDLPRYFIEDAVVEVRGSGDAGGKSAYWVKFVKDAGAQVGHWEETFKPGTAEPVAFDDSTLPLALTRQADGTFTLNFIPWALRLVGSTANSVTVPSFIGHPINSMFFARGRLGFLASENVVLSRTQNLYNLWRKSASVDADDDPIDVTVSANKVSDLRHAAPFQRQIMLFSSTAQFPLTGGDILTARNVRVDPATEFDCSTVCSPVSSGNDLFFFYERSGVVDGKTYGGVREYFVNVQSTTNEAIDITAHVPQYIPSDIFHASVSSTEDTLLVQAKTTPNTVYFYKYLWDGDKRVQSAWGRWVFRPSDNVRAADIDRTTVNLVIQRADGIHLERMSLQATATTGALPFQIHLDSLAQDDRAGLPPAYDAVLDETTLWYPNSSVDTSWAGVTEGEIVIVSGGDYTVGAGQTLPVVGTAGSLGYKVKGNWVAHPCYFGIRYPRTLGFSQQFARDRNGIAMQQGRLQLKHLTVNFKDGVSFRAEVTTPGRDVAVYTYSALQLGIIGSTIGTPVLRSGSFTFPVASDATHASIALINDTPYPATFYSAEWEGLFSTRTPRR